jgi:hypothetical protein
MEMMKVDISATFPVLERKHSISTIKYNAVCHFSIDALYQFGEILFNA